MKALKQAASNLARVDLSKLPQSNTKLTTLSPEGLQPFSLSEKEYNKVREFHKSLRQRAYESLFGFREVRDTTFTIYDVYAYGNQGYLSGYFEDDCNSIDVLVKHFNVRKTEAIILSELSPLDLDVYFHQEEGYMKPLTLVEERQGFIKQILHELYRDVCKYNPVYHKDKTFEGIVVYEADEVARRRIIHVPLSIGMWGAEEEKVNVLLGAPHPLLVHEDLSLSIELDELRTMWKEVTEAYIDAYYIYLIVEQKI